MIPRTSIAISKKDKPWITPILKHLINLRWQAYRARNFVLYNHYKNKIKSEIIAAKQNRLNKLISTNKNPKGLWSSVKEVHNKSISSSPLNDLVNDFDSIDCATICINSHFASVFQTDSLFFL